MAVLHDARATGITNNDDAPPAPEPSASPVGDPEKGGGLVVPIAIGLGALALPGIGSLAFMHFRKAP